MCCVSMYLQASQSINKYGKYLSNQTCQHFNSVGDFRVIILVLELIWVIRVIRVIRIIGVILIIRVVRVIRVVINC
jgi:hypothetical protein